MIGSDDLADAIERALGTEPLDAGAIALLSESIDALRAGAAVVRRGELLSSKEAAALLQVDRTTVSRWRSSGYLPEPFDEVGAGPLWLRPRLEVFAAGHREHADRAGRRPLGTAR